MHCTHVMFSGHAITRMFQRGVSKDDVVEVIQGGEQIRDYPDDTPYPSYLMLGYVKQRPLHVLVAKDAATATCFVVTAYIPDPALWSSDFRSKRS